MVFLLDGRLRSDMFCRQRGRRRRRDEAGRPARDQLDVGAAEQRPEQPRRRRHRARRTELPQLVLSLRPLLRVRKLPLETPTRLLNSPRAELRQDFPNKAVQTNFYPQDYNHDTNHNNHDTPITWLSGYHNRTASMDGTCLLVRGQNTLECRFTIA